MRRACEPGSGDLFKVSKPVLYPQHFDAPRVRDGRYVVEWSGSEPDDPTLFANRREEVRVVVLNRSHRAQWSGQLRYRKGDLLALRRKDAKDLVRRGVARYSEPDRADLAERLVALREEGRRIADDGEGAIPAEAEAWLRDADAWFSENSGVGLAADDLLGLHDRIRGETRQGGGAAGAL